MSEQIFYVIEDGKVFAKATKWFEQRLLTTLPEKNHEATLGFLHEKFEELDKEVTFLLLEYKNAPDKLKLAGKINRQKNYMTAAKAIGDYTRIIQPLEELELELKEIVDSNVTQRLNIIKDAEALSVAEGDWKSKTEKLQGFAKALKALPMVPDIRVEETRKRLEEIRDEFFTSKSKHFEDSEKITLDNLTHKIELCEKAEALSASTSWKETAEAINKLNEEWKTVGHVPRHRSEELWMRFNEAKEKFFSKRKEFFGDLKTAHEGNLVLKLALIEKAEALKESRDWKKTSDEYTKLMDEWKKSGPVSLEQKDEVWNKFIEAKNHFYAAKDTYYSSIKLNLEDNYARKMSLVLRTEEVATMESMDWDNATMEILEMVDEWKTIGRIPKEYGDEAWERFLKAKKDFFDRKDKEREKRRAEGGKMLDDKLKRNRGYFNKLKRELDLEEEVMFDFKDRLKNLPPSIRSFDTKERYEGIIEDAEKKVNFLKAKLQEVKNNMEADEKEFRFVSRPFKKKEDNSAPKKSNENEKDAPIVAELLEDKATEAIIPKEEVKLEIVEKTEDEKTEVEKIPEQKEIVAEDIQNEVIAETIAEPIVVSNETEVVSIETKVDLMEVAKEEAKKELTVHEVSEPAITDLNEVSTKTTPIEANPDVKEAIVFETPSANIESTITDQEGLIENQEPPIS
jgi:Domain of Unknown Function (DUF349)